jgi:hypothetical protein
MGEGPGSGGSGEVGGRVGGGLWCKREIGDESGVAFGAFGMKDGGTGKDSNRNGTGCDLERETDIENVVEKRR